MAEAATFLGPGTDLVEDSFPTDRGWEVCGWFGGNGRDGEQRWSLASSPVPLTSCLMPGPYRWPRGLGVGNLCSMVFYYGTQSPLRHWYIWIYFSNLIVHLQIVLLCFVFFNLKFIMIVKIIFLSFHFILYSLGSYMLCD